MPFSSQKPLEISSISGYKGAETWRRRQCEEEDWEIWVPRHRWLMLMSAE